MPFLRNPRLIARLALVWFALSLGVAIASPLVQPKGLELVCTGVGPMKFVVHSGDDATDVATHTLDCPLCAMTSAPPPVATLDFTPPFALSHALLPVEVARIAARIGATWQARAPPAFS